MDVKGVKLEEIKKIVLEYCTNLGQEAQEERGEVISYLRAMLTRCLREMSGTDLCSILQQVLTDSSGRYNILQLLGPVRAPELS